LNGMVRAVWRFAAMLNAQPVEPVTAVPKANAAEAPESQRRPTSPGAPEAVFWHGLISGALRFVDASCDFSSYVAVFDERPGAAPRLSNLELLLLCRAFQGEAQKNLAFEFNVSPATISQLLATARSKLGLGARVAATPLPIVFLALRHCGVAELPSVRLGRVQREGHEYSELRWSPLDADTLTELSQVERRVALQFAWGASYKEIAAQRGTSMHTVANQIASICGKLRVHGRFELIRRWSERQWGIPQR
jgi:DNA-binding NarL/FixJ family response regulator